MKQAFIWRCICLVGRQEVNEADICVKIFKFANVENSYRFEIIGSVFLCKRLIFHLENIVKYIPIISDDSWTYGDLMAGVI